MGVQAEPFRKHGEIDSLYVASLSESHSSYLLVTSRRASYPAQMATMASRLKMSDAVPVTCHCRNTMHRFVVSHVNSICEGETREEKVSLYGFSFAAQLPFLPPSSCELRSSNQPPLPPAALLLALS